MHAQPEVSEASCCADLRTQPIEARVLQETTKRNTSRNQTRRPFPVGLAQFQTSIPAFPGVMQTPPKRRITPEIPLQARLPRTELKS